jgi:hypothetical protein
VKIVAHDPSSTFSDITLGADGASSGTDVFVDPAPMPVEQRSEQIEDVAFGSEPFVANRGNRRVSLTWTVERVHASQDAALSFITGHGDLVPYGVTVSIKWTDDAGTTYTYTGGSIASVDLIDWQNIRTRWRYKVNGLTPP